MVNCKTESDNYFPFHNINTEWAISKHPSHLKLIGRLYAAAMVRKSPPEVAHSSSKQNLPNLILLHFKHLGIRFCFPFHYFVFLANKYPTYFDDQTNLGLRFFPEQLRSLDKPRYHRVSPEPTPAWRSLGRGRPCEGASPSTRKATELSWQKPLPGPGFA